MTRQLRGSPRKIVGDKCLTVIPATMVREETFKADIAQLKNLNAGSVRSETTIRKVRSEKLQSMDFDKDDMLDLPRFRDHLIEKKDPYISKILFKPFEVYLHSPKQFEIMELLIKYYPDLKLILRLDATTNLIKKPDQAEHNVLLHALTTTMYTIKDPKNRGPSDLISTEFPLSYYISESQESANICLWLMNFFVNYKKLYPNSKLHIEWIVTDFSWANIHAILEACNNITIREYLNLTYNWVVKENRR